MFALEQRAARLHLSDANPELMICYKVIKEECDGLIALLAEHKRKHSKNHFYAVREQHDLDLPVERAARFIYLNKTCYNGLYRVNKAGRFNAPLGSYANPLILDEDNLRAVSEVLRKAYLRWGEFKDITPQAGDLVYCDPPYDETYNGYTTPPFGLEDQTKLASAARDWVGIGASVIISNSDTHLIRSLYPRPQWTLLSITAPRNISCQGATRNATTELIITNA